jgi:hypothetical protein
MSVKKYFYKFIKAASGFFSHSDLSLQDFERLESKRYKTTKSHWEVL